MKGIRKQRNLTVDLSKLYPIESYLSNITMTKLIPSVTRTSCVCVYIMKYKKGAKENRIKMKVR